MVPKMGRRQIDPEIAARWKKLTSDQGRLRALYEACGAAEEDIALADAGMADYAARLARIDAGKDA